MKKYALVFSVAYFVVAMLLAVVAEWLKVKSGTSFGISAIFAASVFASWKFTKDHHREPTLVERKAYAWQALLGLWGVSLLAIAAVIPFYSSAEERQSLLNLLSTWWFLAIMVGVALFISAISYVAIRWSFGWYAKTACKAANAA